MDVLVKLIMSATNEIYTLVNANQFVMDAMAQVFLTVSTVLNMRPRTNLGSVNETNTGLDLIVHHIFTLENVIQSVTNEEEMVQICAQIVSLMPLWMILDTASVSQVGAESIEACTSI